METESAAAFEECFGRLQQAIDRLEEGGLPLETALDVFEESMRLASDCHRILEHAELRLSRLVDDYGPRLGLDRQA